MQGKKILLAPTGSGIGRRHVTSAHIAPLAAGRGVAPLALRAFFIAFLLLQISQLFVYPPGSDVSPYASTIGALQSITFAGQTAQIWALVAILIVVLATSALHAGAGGGPTAVVLLGVGILAFSGLVNFNSASDYLDAFGKLVVPLVVYLYLSSSWLPKSPAPFAKALRWANIFVIGQALVCKALWGEFSANRYYLELAEEYFGFFYHPFAFSGILGVCCIVALGEIARGRERALNAALIVVNMFFIYQSQVRTYLLAVGLVVVLAGAAIVRGRGYRPLTAVAVGGIAVLAYASSVELLSPRRSTADYSSGRLERWSRDLEFFFQQSDFPQLLFGGGPGYSYKVNELLFGVSINSLNAAVDVLLDFGLLGLLSLIAVWVAILRDVHLRAGSALIVPATAFLVVAASVTNVFGFPAVSLSFCIALAYIRRTEWPADTVSASAVERAAL